MISSLLVPLASEDGGIAVRVGAGATHTDTTAATVPVMDTAIAVGLE